MDYKYLTDEQKMAMAEDRVRNLEAEHFSNTMALRAAKNLLKGSDSESKEVVNNQIKQLENNLEVIESAHADAVSHAKSLKVKKPQDHKKSTKKAQPKKEKK